MKRAPGRPREDHSASKEKGKIARDKGRRAYHALVTLVRRKLVEANDRGLSWAEIGRLTGMSRTYVYNLATKERGKEPSIEAIASIIYGLGITLPMILSAINIEKYKAYRIVEGLSHGEFSQLGGLSPEQIHQIAKIFRTFLPEQDTTSQPQTPENPSK